MCLTKANRVFKSYLKTLLFFFVIKIFTQKVICSFRSLDYQTSVTVVLLAFEVPLEIVCQKASEVEQFQSKVFIANRFLGWEINGWVVSRRLNTRKKDTKTIAFVIGTILFTVRQMNIAADGKEISFSKKAQITSNDVYNVSIDAAMNYNP